MPQSASSPSLRSLPLPSICALVLSAACVAVACSDERYAPLIAPPAEIAVAEVRADAGVALEPTRVEADAGVVVAEGDAGASTDPSAVAAAEPIPTLLSQAGLFEADMETLAPGVRPYEPRFALWSDGASKRRWVFLPEGAQIDTSNMEYWSYPAGTRLYKEFSVGGVRVETRLLQRQANGAWWMMSYQWRRNRSDADAVPNGVVNASNTEHDIPSTEDCRTCHLRMPDKALGFSAIQLSREAEPLNPDEWSLERLQAAGKLTNAPPAIQLFPEDQRATEVLGYLHANCGHCHQPRSSVSSRVSLSLWLRTDQLGSVEQTPMYLSTVGKPVNLSLVAQGAELLQIVAPGSSQDSALFARASSRGEAYSMPPLSTKQADPVITELLRQWIESLDDPPPPEDDNSDDGNADGDEGVEDDGSDDGSEGDGSDDEDGSEGEGSDDDGSEEP